LSQVGIALIGPGNWGWRLAAAVGQTPSLRLVTCFGRNESQRQTFAGEFGCEAAPSFEAAIEHPNVQGVLLVTPNNIHAEQVQACARRGKHVFVEKPIADTLADGQVIAAACREAGVTLLVGHAFRRLGAARKVKQLLEAGTLGTVVLAEANFSLPGTLTPDKWRFYRDSCPGGPLLQLGIHHTDTMQYWLGPIRRVRGSFARLVTQAEIDDLGVALLEFAGGARATLTSSYVSPKTFYLRLYGSEANLHYETDMSIWPKAELMDAATRLTLQTKAGQEPVSFESHNMLVEELDEFARCIRGEAVPETGVAEALAALRVIRGAIDSHQSGQICTLENDLGGLKRDA
jgi:predicted dehydrogenase